MKTIKLTSMELLVLRGAVSELQSQTWKDYQDYLSSCDGDFDDIEHTFSAEEMEQMEDYTDRIAYLEKLHDKLEKASFNK